MKHQSFLIHLLGCISAWSFGSQRERDDRGRLRICIAEDRRAFGRRDTGRGLALGGIAQVLDLDVDLLPRCSPGRDLKRDWGVRLYPLADFDLPHGGQDLPWHEQGRGFRHDLHAHGEWHDRKRLQRLIGIGTPTTKAVILKEQVLIEIDAPSYDRLLARDQGDDRADEGEEWCGGYWGGLPRLLGQDVP